MIYDLILDEMKSRYLYLSEVYGPFYMISYAVHHLNLMNRLKDPETKERLAVYWVSGDVPDLRRHTMMITPSGFMKTTYMKAMSSIFKDAGRKLVFKEEMTASGLVGTVSRDPNGDSRPIEGVAEKHADDIIMIDEFTSITKPANNAYNASMIPYLLAILDHGHVVRDLAGGSINYYTRMSLWGGVQPSHFELSSGLARRFQPMIFMPTRHDNMNLIKLKKNTAGIREDPVRSDYIVKQVKEWLNSFSIVSNIEFTDRVYDFYEDPSNSFFQFECDSFNIFLLGYHLLKYGPSENLIVDIGDDEIIRLINLQKEWRRIMLDGIDNVMILNIIKTCLQPGPKNTLICNRKDVAEECKLISWSTNDVYKKLKELEDANHIKRIGEVIEWRGAVPT